VGLAIVLIIISTRGATGNESLDTVLLWTFLFTVFSIVSFVILIGAAALLGFFYEFIVGESILAKLRKRAGNPEKQKGFLTKIGKWLS
jgi:hypothetical protein